MNNKTNISLFLFFCFLLLSSCINQDRLNITLEDVPIVFDIDLVKRMPLKVRHAQYIPLETSQECLIGFVDKVLIKDKKIYIADFQKAKALFVFDMNGKFLFKIARLGKGPDEYISFMDFDIQTNGDIYMFDQWNRRFLIYNSEGNFLSDVKTDYYFSSFCLVENKMYWSMLRNNGKMFANLAIYDMAEKRTELQLTEQQFLHPLELLNFNSYNFYYSPNGIYYSPKFSEIIYLINNKGVFPAIGIKNLIKPSTDVVKRWSQDPYKQIELVYEDIYFIENAYIYETDDYIIFGCMRGTDRNFLLYNKHLKSACSVLSSDFFMTIGYARILGSTGNDFFSVFELNPDNEYHRQILQSRNELADWKEGDNPTIITFNLDMANNADGGSSSL